MSVCPNGAEKEKEKLGIEGWRAGLRVGSQVGFLACKWCGVVLVFIAPQMKKGVEGTEGMTRRLASSYNGLLTRAGVRGSIGFKMREIKRIK